MQVLLQLQALLLLVVLLPQRPAWLQQRAWRLMQALLPPWLPSCHCCHHQRQMLQSA